MRQPTILLLAVAGALAFAPLSAEADSLYVANYDTGTIGKYDVQTGAVESASFITGLSSPGYLATSGNSLFVGNLMGQIGVYNATTGVAINSSFINMGSGNYLMGMTVYNGNLYALNYTSGGLNVYSASTGALLSSNFISGINTPSGVSISGGFIYIVNSPSGSNNYIGKYDLQTGAVVNSTLATTKDGAVGLVASGSNAYVVTTGNQAIDKFDLGTGNLMASQQYYSQQQSVAGPTSIVKYNNTLFVSDEVTNSVYTLDASTLEVTGSLGYTFQHPSALAISSVPEPAEYGLMLTSAAGLVAVFRRKRKN